MRITIDGTEYKIPSSLMDITLAERIEFDKQYGNALKEQLKKLIEMKDGIDREMEFTSYHLELACKTLSFFGKIPMDIIENTNIDEVLTIYHHTMKVMSDDTDFTNPDFKLESEFYWKGETWNIAAPELKHDSVMTFGEFLDAKQSVQNLNDLGEEKFESLLPLACVYFRKKGERYDKEFVIEDGERYKLMKSLPLLYALHVGFFLNDSLHMYLSTSPFSGHPGPPKLVEM